MQQQTQLNYYSRYSRRKKQSNDLNKSSITNQSKETYRSITNKSKDKIFIQQNNTQKVKEISQQYYNRDENKKDGEFEYYGEEKNSDIKRQENEKNSSYRDKDKDKQMFLQINDYDNSQQQQDQEQSHKSYSFSNQQSNDHKSSNKQQQIQIREYYKKSSETQKRYFNNQQLQDSNNQGYSNMFLVEQISEIKGYGRQNCGQSQKEENSNTTFEEENRVMGLKNRAECDGEKKGNKNEVVKKNFKSLLKKKGNNSSTLVNEELGNRSQEWDGGELIFSPKFGEMQEFQKIQEKELWGIGNKDYKKSEEIGYQKYNRYENKINALDQIIKQHYNSKYQKQKEREENKQENKQEQEQQEKDKKEKSPENQFYFDRQDQRIMQQSKNGNENRQQDKWISQNQQIKHKQSTHQYQNKFDKNSRVQSSEESLTLEQKLEKAYQQNFKSPPKKQKLQNSFNKNKSKKSSESKSRKPSPKILQFVENSPNKSIKSQKHNQKVTIPQNSKTKSNDFSPPISQASHKKSNKIISSSPKQSKTPPPKKVSFSHTISKLQSLREFTTTLPESKQSSYIPIINKLFSSISVTKSQIQQKRKSQHSTLQQMQLILNNQKLPCHKYLHLITKTNDPQKLDILYNKIIIESIVKQLAKVSGFQ